MAINYIIQAEVVDINADSPTPKDIFFVDTNVWYWMTYPNAATASFPGQLDYPTFVNRALAAGAKICHSGLSLAEMTHLIEKTERDIHEKSVGLMIRAKEYRHNLPGERSRVVSEVEAAWGQVKSLSSPLTLTVDEKATDAALDRFRAEKLDGYDLFILETMKNHGVIQIITDDGDFATVAGIRMFTANRNVLLAAQTQGKLLARISNTP